jgi:transglutaminase-like putative cysteine protease
MMRHVEAHLELEVTTTADLVLAIAVSRSANLVAESLVVTADNSRIDPTTIDVAYGGRLHQLRNLMPARIVVDYSATVEGVVEPIPATEREWYQYIRPSRYCESDRLGPLARAQFAGLNDHELLAAVSSWVGSNVSYIPGSSRATDGAVSTLLARSGVCRDFAHLTVALLRANGIPARVVSVYAPGLDPMDFHAVVEVCVDNAWYVVDPTCLAPRSSLVRGATGADASDTAFLTVVTGSVELTLMEIGAVVDPCLPEDDLSELVRLG